MTNDTKNNTKNTMETEDSLDNVEWNAEDEVKLFYALRNHKPVGVNRHFDMVCVREELSRLMKREVPTRLIWKHLDQMYDMDALHENEELPFPNSQEDFLLPSEFDELKNQKIITFSGSSNESTASDTNDDSNHSRAKSDTAKSSTGRKSEVERKETRSESREKEETRSHKPKRSTAAKEGRTEDKSTPKAATLKKRRSQA